MSSLQMLPIPAESAITQYFKPLEEIMSNTIGAQGRVKKIKSFFDALHNDKSLTETNLRSYVATLCVYMFYLRDCRGGCGRRIEFYNIFLVVAEVFPKVIIGVLEFIQEFGYFKDYFQILSGLDTMTAPAAVKEEIREHIVNLIANQLQRDDLVLKNSESSAENDKTNNNVEKSNSKISLCAKYCPREGKSFALSDREIFKSLISKLYPTLAATPAKAQYRKLLVRLCKALDVAEQKLTANSVMTVDDMKDLPKQCLQRNIRTLLDISTVTPISTVDTSQLCIPRTKNVAEKHNHNDVSTGIVAKETVENPENSPPVWLKSLLQEMALREKVLPVRLHEIVRTLMAKEDRRVMLCNNHRRKVMLQEWRRAKHDRGRRRPAQRRHPRGKGGKNIRKMARPNENQNRKREANKAKSAAEDKSCLDLPSLAALDAQQALTQPASKTAPSYFKNPNPHINISESLVVAPWQRLCQPPARSIPAVVTTSAHSQDDNHNHHSHRRCLNLQNMVGIVDTSGSMRGRPVEVGLALSLFASHCQTIDGFKQRVLTFDTCPQWVSLPPLTSENPSLLSQQIQMVLKAPCSYHCNLYLTLMVIAQVAMKEKLSRDNMPDVVIFSDREFLPNRTHEIFLSESGKEPLEKQLQDAEAYFVKCGIPMPRIVYWNLRGDQRDNLLVDKHTVTFRKYTSVKSNISIDLFSGCLYEQLYGYFYPGRVKDTVPTNATVTTDTTCESESPQDDQLRPPMVATTLQMVDEGLSGVISREESGSGASSLTSAVDSEPPISPVLSSLSHHFRSKKKQESFTWAALLTYPRYFSLQSILLMLLEEHYPQGILREQFQSSEQDHKARTPATWGNGWDENWDN